MGRRFRRVKRFVRRHATHKNYKRAVGIARDVAWLKSVVNVEKKYNDVINGSTAITTTQTYTLLNGLSLGTSSITRNGQSVKFVNINWRFYVVMNVLATTTMVRFVIFKDKQANAAAPAVGDVVLTTGGTQAQLNIGNGKRFRILVDKYLTLDTNNPIREFKRWRRLRVHTEYNTGNAGTIADIQTNSIYFMIFSDQNVNQATYTGYFRLRYVDN